VSKILHFLASLPIGRQLSERHRPSGLPTAPQEPPDSIESYLDACRRKVEAARTDLDSQQRAWIVEGNSPYVLKPDAPGRPGRGILMLHGLSDSPFLVRDIARYFHRKGFYVLAMQLPGHGTRPGDLLHVSWKDWATAHQQLLELMRAEVDDIYLLGFSAGATLNLYQSIRNADIKGLFMFAPALRISFMSWLACPLAYLGKWSRRLAWFDVQPDTDCFKYESLTTRSICEVREMIKAVRRLNALVEREIAQGVPRLTSLEDYLEFVADVLGNPQQYLNGCSSSIRLSRLGIKLEGGRTDAGNEIPLFLFRLASHTPRVGSLVRFPRAELLPPQDFVRRADLFLTL